MTTTLAIIAAVILFSKVGLSFISGFLIFVGLIQFLSKWQMNCIVNEMVEDYEKSDQVKGYIEEYIDPEEGRREWRQNAQKAGLEAIPNFLTSVNMFSSFIIYGIFIYSLFKLF